MIILNVIIIDFRNKKSTLDMYKAWFMMINEFFWDNMKNVMMMAMKVMY